MTTSSDDLESQIRHALEQARALLPQAADVYAARGSDPEHPASINTLQSYRESMDEGEYEVALYSLAGIAWAVSAGEDCWSSLDAAARLMGFDEQRRRRAFLAGVETLGGESGGSQGGPVTPPQ